MVRCLAVAQLFFNVFLKFLFMNIYIYSVIFILLKLILNLYKLYTLK